MMSSALILGAALYAIIVVFVAILIGRWVGESLAEQYLKRFEHERSMRKSAEESFHQLAQGVARDLKSLIKEVEDRHHDIPYLEVNGDGARFMIPRFDKVECFRCGGGGEYESLSVQAEHGEMQDYAIRFRVYIPYGQWSKVCRDAALITQGARLFRDAIVKESERRQLENPEPLNPGHHTMASK